VVQFVVQFVAQFVVQFCAAFRGAICGAICGAIVREGGAWVPHPRPSGPGGCTRAARLREGSRRVWGAGVEIGGRKQA